MLRNGTIRTLRVVIALCLLSLVGCGTLIARTPNSHSHYDYYKGTQANVELLTMRGATGYSGYTTVFCWMSIVCPVVAIVSLPVDVVADTALLPYDAIND
ncbi:MULTISPECIES: YceK/YidQ family lipoprotein [Pseudomonas]|uniref:YceK/YidQ family lipoprotein n=1 Tax=Pseudomonas sessilinigenes TaxID=658629 RepID=A0ABX8MZ34_9PSED|nr:MULTISPECIES: YceK/YidQ family lipoprotein [Pseudomonas]QIH11932.1 YceK/YidQ family lipoprotein [Pseudomonas sp. BIOMIG1BAC]QXH43783.1 YceK/YidQ family lipoprotein [Pseudomonas sessilinigenes]UMZ15332.1 YceK/YidQ family lipoprotein [Pseudomonas sp. MPFS]